MRELLIAADARRSHDFDSAAHVMCLLANIHRDTNHRPTPYAPVEFHPWHVADVEASKRADRTTLNRAVFRAMYRATAEKTGSPIPKGWDEST